MIYLQSFERKIDIRRASKKRRQGKKIWKNTEKQEKTFSQVPKDFQ